MRSDEIGLQLLSLSDALVTDQKKTSNKFLGKFITVFVPHL